MKDELRKELEKRGTAEISSGIVNQVTQAVDEKPDKVKFLVFGELQESRIMPIETACAKCTCGYFSTTVQCRAFQKKDADARGFHNLICPNQFIEDDTVLMNDISIQSNYGIQFRKVHQRVFTKENALAKMVTK